jgi:hypothetical protein
LELDGTRVLGSLFFISSKSSNQVKGGQHLPKHMGQKWGAMERTCWGTHWELAKHNGNLMGTHWELEGNKMGTRREQGQNEKQNRSLSSNCPKLKRKKTRHLECNAWAFPLASYMMFPKEFVTIFGLG